MKRPREKPAVATNGKHIYVFGGDTTERSAERYCIETNTWKPFVGIPRYIRNFAVVCI